MLALSWYDKRRVLMLSTKHTNKIVMTTSRYVLYYKKSRVKWKILEVNVYLFGNLRVQARTQMGSPEPPFKINDIHSRHVVEVLV